jgi:hypothetical protein
VGVINVACSVYISHLLCMLLDDILQIEAAVLHVITSSLSLPCRLESQHNIFALDEKLMKPTVRERGYCS